MQRKKKDLNFSYAGLKNAFRMAVAKVKEVRGLPEEADVERQDKVRCCFVCALRLLVTCCLDEEESLLLTGCSPVQQHKFWQADLAASFQHVAIQHLEERLERAMRLCDSPPEGSGHGQQPITTLAVVGGVAANQAIRARLKALCEKRSAALAANGGGGGRSDQGARAWRLVVPPPRLCTDNGVMVAWAAIEKLRLGYSDVIEGQDVYARWPFANPVDRSGSGEATTLA